MKHLPRRRRLEAKTDYKARLALLTSEMPRIIVRRTNKYIIAQAVVSEGAQDKVIYGCTSRNLLEKGWPETKRGSLKSIPAAYLTGLLLGNAIKGKIAEAILDIGMQRNIQKSRLYAVLRGILEAGVKVPHSEEALPDDDRLQSNEELRPIMAKVKQKL
ncbi:MAG TPA: 50S ribosomal protein L18 [Candidatus Nanoarchaeia archaeon]|nr:50S ribosomal protein L18 [Candidatus Nanoarchaeia archaeon]